MRGFIVAQWAPAGLSCAEGELQHLLCSCSFATWAMSGSGAPSSPPLLGCAIPEAVWKPLPDNPTGVMRCFTTLEKCERHQSRGWSRVRAAAGLVLPVAVGAFAVPGSMQPQLLGRVSLWEAGLAQPPCPGTDAAAAAAPRSLRNVKVKGS